MIESGKVKYHVIELIKNDVNKEELEKYIKNDKAGSVLDVDEHGNSAMHYSAEKEHGDFTRIILDYFGHGLPAVIRNHAGDFPIHVALENHDACCTCSNCPLHYLVNTCDKDLYINAINSEGKTCLHMAIERLDVNAINKLLDHGADILAKNKQGISALEYGYSLEEDSFCDNPELFYDMKNIIIEIMFNKLKELKVI